MSASVRPASTAGARHRQRAEAVDQALLQVLGEPERGDEAAEDIVWTMIPGIRKSA